MTPPYDIVQSDATKRPVRCLSLVVGEGTLTRDHEPFFLFLSRGAVTGLERNCILGRWSRVLVVALRTSMRYSPSEIRGIRLRGGCIVVISVIVVVKKRHDAGDGS